MHGVRKLSKVGIYVTQNAWKKMADIIKVSNNYRGFFFHASSGGCSGFNFKLDLLTKEIFDDIKNKKPTIVRNDSTQLYIDPLSEMFLLGTTIDYVEENYSKGLFENKFLFHVNPKLASSCGCGISFSPKKL